MNSSFRFTLDVQRSQSQTSIPVSLNDTAITLYINLMDGGSPLFIDDGCLAKLSIARPSGTKLHEFCRIDRNTTLVYPFSKNKNTAAEQGIHECEVTVYGIDGNQITSARFTMIVSERVANMDGGTGITEDSIGIIDEIVKEEVVRRTSEEERMTAEENRAAAEDVRVAAEETRVTAEEERVAAYKKIEHDTAESINKILQEQEKIIDIQNSLMDKGYDQETLGNIIALQQSYIGGEN